MLLTFQLTFLQDTAEKVSHETYHFFTAAVVVGLLSMAIIQTFKDMLPVRRWFQRSWLLRWLDEKNDQVRQRQNIPADSREAEKDLVQLAADGDYNSFYNLPIEQLCGQMNAAAQAALDFPRLHGVLLRYVGSQADPADLDKLIGGPPEAARKPRSQLMEDKDSKAIEEIDNYVDVRNRVAHQIQRAIDALQVSTGQRWKLWIQILSMAISLIIALMGASLFGDISGWRRAETIVAVALLGGFFAPIARDLIAGLQQLRN